MVINWTRLSLMLFISLLCTCIPETTECVKSNNANGGREGVVNEVQTFLSSHCADAKDVMNKLEMEMKNFVNTQMKAMAEKQPCATPPTFQFPNDGHVDYVQYLGPIPTLTSFTLCAWISPNSDGGFAQGTIASYCNDPTTYCNQLLVTIRGHGQALYVFIDEHHKALNIDRVQYWTHLCVSMPEDSDQNNVQVYFNASNVHSWSRSDFKSSIEGSGVLILGQDQDQDVLWHKLPGKPNPSHTDQGFNGKIRNFYMWDRSLNASEIATVYNSSCYFQGDMLVSFNNSNFCLVGDIHTSVSGSKCSA